MDPLIFYAVTILVILGKFADYIVRQRVDTDDGQGRARLPIPPDRYSTEDIRRTRPQGHFRYQALVRTEGVFERIFGGRFVKGLSGYGHVVLISAFFVQGTFIFSTFFFSDAIWNHQSIHFLAMWVVAGLLGLVIANCAFDVLSIFLTRFLLRRAIALRSTRHATLGTWYKDPLLLFVGGLPGVILIYYILVYSTMNLSFSFIITLRGFATGYFDGITDVALTQWSIFTHDSIIRFLDPWTEGSRLGVAGMNAIYFCITPLLPPLLALSAVGVGVIMDSAEDLTQGGVSRRMEVFSDRCGPVFAIIASGLAITGSAAAALIAIIK